jgi:hypothetical protein
MFEVWRNVLVMGMGALKGGVTRMWLGVVPIELLFPPPHLISVRVDNNRKSIIDKSLTNNQVEVVVEI